MERLNVVKRITLLAMLASISSVIKILFQATTGPAARLTFYELPLILAGSMFGPIYGMLAGLVSDIGYMTTYGYGFSLMTISAMMWGFVSGLILYRRTITFKKIIMVVFIASTLEFLINGYQLFIWNLGSNPELTWQMFMVSSTLRSVILIAKWPVQIYLVHLLYTRVMDFSPLVIVKQKSINPIAD